LPGYDAVAGRVLGVHVEVHAAVRLEGVVLAERAFVEEHVHPLAGRELAASVLPLHARGAAAGVRFGDQPVVLGLEVLLRLDQRAPRRLRVRRRERGAQGDRRAQPGAAGEGAGGGPQSGRGGLHHDVGRGGERVRAVRE